MAAFTMAQYTALCSAIARGAREVWYGDKRVQFNSFGDMLSLKKIMETDLGIAINNSGRTYSEFNKGL